jgi:HxlR-like helix-turn-helix protein
LQRVLPGISTEQLRSRLNRMVADGMLTRKRYREVPPRVDYELTERAQELMPILGELARWGYEWAWSAPRPSESVDIGAILRIAPGLLDSSGAPRGTAEFVVSDGKGGEPASYVFTVSKDRVSIAEHEAHADARVKGDTAAWVRAFSPGGDRQGLQIKGNRQLAEWLLDGLSATAGHVAGASSAVA